MRVAELLQRSVAEWEIHVINNLVFTDNGSNMVAAFQSKQHNDDIAESDGDEYNTDSVTLEESEELFPDLKDEMDKIVEGASSEVDNLDICEKDHQEAFVCWKHSGSFVHTLQLVVKVLKLHQHVARVNSALAIVKKVNKSCRATPDTASWKSQ